MRPQKTRITLLVFLVVLLVLLPACIGPLPEEPAQPTVTSPPSEVESTPEPAEGTVDEEQILITPTLAPTSTPDPLSDVAYRIVEITGVERVSFLTLTVEDWINLGISLLIILLSVLLIARFLIYLLDRLADRTSIEYDDRFIKAIRPQIRWLAFIISSQYATNRLLFLSPWLKQSLGQIYFTLYVLLGVSILWKLIDAASEWFIEQAEKLGRSERSESVFLLGQRALRVLLLMIGVIIVLDHYGINVNALITALGIGGLALSLAAQDTLSNIISGIIIMLDQPFRVGDRIEIQGLDTWGDVVDIGVRTTRIRTRDNRLVIVPNSSISGNQIVNYTYPDPRYRVQIQIGVEYGVDLKGVRRIIIEAVQEVEGVLLDKPIEVLFLEFGDSAMILRVRWWIDSYVDTRRMFDKVNEAIYIALDEAGVEMPPTTIEVSLSQGKTGMDISQES